MKKFCKYFLGLVVCLSLMTVGVSNASATTTEGAETPKTTLTVVFSSPSEFDVMAGAGVPAVESVAFSEAALVGTGGGGISEEPEVTVELMASAPQDVEVTAVSPATIPSAAVMSAPQPVSGDVPEPSTLILVGVGLLGLFGLARRKNKKG